MTFLTRKGLMSPKLQLLSGHAEERNLAIYRDLALTDISPEYEQAMQSFPVRRREILLRLSAASLPLPQHGGVGCGLTGIVKINSVVRSMECSPTASMLLLTENIYQADGGHQTTMAIRAVCPRC